MANISTYVGSAGGTGGGGGVTNAYESSQYYCIKSKCNISEGQLVVVERGCNEARDAQGGIPGKCLFEYGCNGFGQCVGQTANAAQVEFYCATDRFATIDYRGAWCCGHYAGTGYETGLIRAMAHCIDADTGVITSSCIYECTFTVGPQGPAPAQGQNWYCCFWFDPCCSNCANWDWIGLSGVVISAPSCSGTMAAVLNSYSCCFKRTSSPACCICTRAYHEMKLCYCTTTCEISVISVCCAEWNSCLCSQQSFMLTNEPQPAYFVGMYQYKINCCCCCTGGAICHIVQKLDDNMCLLCHAGAAQSGGVCPRSVWEPCDCCGYNTLYRGTANAPGVMPFTQGADGWILTAFRTGYFNCCAPFCCFFTKYWAWRPTGNQCFEYTTSTLRESDIPCLPYCRCTYAGTVCTGGGEFACGWGEAGRAWDDGNGVKKLLINHRPSNANYNNTTCSCTWFTTALTCFCVDPTSKCLCTLGTDPLGCLCSCLRCNTCESWHAYNTPYTYINAWVCRQDCCCFTGFSGTSRTALRGRADELSTYDGHLYQMSRTICRETACYAAIIPASQLFGTLTHPCLTDLFNKCCNDCVKGGGYIELGDNCCNYAFLKFYHWCNNSTCFNAECNPSVITLDSDTANYRFATCIMFNHPIGRPIPMTNGYIGTLAPAICGDGCGYGGMCTCCGNNSCRRYDQCIYQIRCDWEAKQDNTGQILGIAQNTVTPGSIVCVAVPGTIDKTCFTKCYILPVATWSPLVGEIGCNLKTCAGDFGTPLACYFGSCPEPGSSVLPQLTYHQMQCQSGSCTCNMGLFAIAPYWDVNDSDYYGAITKCGSRDPNLPQF